jgi:antitoxin HicB
MGYDIYIRQKNRLYIAEVPALPGCHTVGRSETEVLENIRDVIEGYFRMLQKKHEPLPRVKVFRVWRDNAAPRPA